VTWLDPGRGVVVAEVMNGQASARRVSDPAAELALEGPSCFVRDGDLWVSSALRGAPLDTGASTELAAVVWQKVGTAGIPYLEPRPDRTLLVPALAPSRLGLAVLAYEKQGTGAILRLVRARDRTDAILPTPPLRFAPRRSDPAWVGDYVGLAVDGEHAYAAYVDNGEGHAPHVAFASFE
jgi:hypothetical protein